MHSIILTVHNKGWLIDKVIQGIKDNTVGEYELIVVVDGWIGCGCCCCCWMDRQIDG